MPLKKKAFDKPLRVRYRGQFDYDGLIALLRSFFDRARICIEEPKFKYKGHPTGFEPDFRMQGDVKVSPYVKIYMEIKGHGFDINPKETVVNGVKKRMTGGKIELLFQGWFETDWGGGFDIKKGFSPIRKTALKKMQHYMDEENEGLMYLEHKAIGKDHIKKLLRKFQKDTVEFLGMECY